MIIFYKSRRTTFVVTPTRFWIYWRYFYDVVIKIWSILMKLWKLLVDP